MRQFKPDGFYVPLLPMVFLILGFLCCREKLRWMWQTYSRGHVPTFPVCALRQIQAQPCHCARPMEVTGSIQVASSGCVAGESFRARTRQLHAPAGVKHAQLSRHRRGLDVQTLDDAERKKKVCWLDMLFALKLICKSAHCHKMAQVTKG